MNYIRKEAYNDLPDQMISGLALLTLF